MIQTEDLSKQFGDFWAVNGVNLDVQPGQVLALLGQNGAGKTTTIRMLTSVLLPTRGRALIGGHDVAREPDKVRKLVGVLTEQHGLYLRMTGAEYLDFFGQIFGLDPHGRGKRSAELLEYFGLAAAARQRIGEYSKGMRQKLSLARTLIHEPPVLLLDEPTSAMDPESARLVRDSIMGLRSTQRTILLCTHNLVEAELLADHVAIIYRGSILVNGSVDELKKKLLGPATYEVRMRNGWRAGTLNLPPGVDLISESETSARFRVPDADAANPVILQQLMARGDEVITFQEMPRTLEEVYLAAMAQVKHD
jgi:ABC-2 type transport system ATP-binding protein